MSRVIAASLWSGVVRAACAVPCLALAALAVAADAPVRVGERAPALVVPTLDARVFDLTALRGKVVVVNFWATW